MTNSTSHKKQVVKTTFIGYKSSLVLNSDYYNPGCARASNLLILTWKESNNFNKFPFLCVCIWDCG